MATDAAAEVNKIQALEERIKAPSVWGRVHIGLRFEDLQDKRYDEAARFLKKHYLNEDICDADLNALCRSIYLSFGEQHHNSRVYDNCPAKRFSNSTNENGEIFIEHNSYLLGKFI